MTTNSIDLLASIKIASPCSARWEDMTGDDRSRFCGQCEKNVYNFSAMTDREVSDLIRAKEGKLCGRFYRRKDGTMLTANCPVGAALYFSRLKTILATSAALILTGLGLMAATNAGASRQKNQFEQKCDATLWRIKERLGLNPKPVMMGEICVPAPPVVLNTNKTNATNPPSQKHF